jgi:ABC-type thiamine transport system ATPase subunit
MNANPILKVDGLVITGSVTSRTGELLPGGKWDWVGLAGPTECELTGDILQGMADPKDGTVTFLGGDPSAHRERVGRIFCGNAFVSNLTIAENLRLAIPFSDESDSEARLETRLREILDACGVKEICTQRPVQLTDAERCFWQWVRAFSRPRDLFIFEEATVLLAPMYRQPLQKLLDAALAEGAALVSLSY